MNLDEVTVCGRTLREIISLDYPSMLPKTSAQDYELIGLGIMTPGLFEEYRLEELSKPLP